MLELSLPELITLGLYTVTAAFLLVATSAKSGRTQSVASWLGLPIGALASLGLYACMTGQADAWFDSQPAATSSAKTITIGDRLPSASPEPTAGTQRPKPTAARSTL